MFKYLVLGARIASNSLVPSTRLLLKNVTQPMLVNSQQSVKCFSSLIPQQYAMKRPLLQNTSVTQISENICRNLTKFSYRKGRRKSVKAVLKRFYRLHWGGWVRTKCGRNKKIWRKSAARMRRLRQHVFCNATQNTLLDKMVGSYWRRPKYYVDDIYEPYHTREEFGITSNKPRPYFPPEK